MMQGREQGRGAAHRLFFCRYVSELHVLREECESLRDPAKRLQNQMAGTQKHSQALLESEADASELKRLDNEKFSEGADERVWGKAAEPANGDRPEKETSSGNGTQPESDDRTEV